MEDRIQTIQSPHFDKDKFKEQLERISQISDDAQKRIDFESAHNPDILKSINVVEAFLRRKHRLCYGGQAINAHLPAKYKFYDPKYNVPDYDFFTPDQIGDIKELVRDLREAGFSEISDREGMHEGTTKLYVNYVPVADLTAIDERLYKLLSEREFKSNGISYMDSNTLRQLMYLELSRPKGEVERWSKVYERLLLLNEFSPAKHCKPYQKKFPRGILNPKEVDAIMDFVVQEQRVLAGADLIGFYKHSFGKKIPSAKWILNARQPIFFYSPDLAADSKHFTYELQHTSSQKTYITKVEALGGDLIPNMTIFLRRNTPFLIILSESACHSYYNVPVKDNKFLRIATIDTLVTLFFALSLLKYKFMSLRALECVANELVEISYRARANPELFPFPFISLICSGHQKALPSLIREKVIRIKRKRKQAKTQKNNKSANSQTRRNRN
jgi:Poly(A) polymerase catalytic subunit